ncbi:L-2-amino-thiazoline-4-carboxylic acid hydrolase [bacterium]|nr:L-2-amino-thiazoline-4-carboxylic acid hydrolase [bacterium]
MKSSRIIYKVVMYRSKTNIARKYGSQFWQEFNVKSNERLNTIMSKTPDIGDSIFAFNYEFCPPYIAWYKTFMELGLSSDQAGEEIWSMNERLVTMIPKWLMPLGVKLYIGGFRKKAAEHERKTQANALHPYDWKILYREINENTFEIDITECGMLKLSRDFDAMGMFPMICRMDYLFSYYMGSGFERTKTLADGDDCCNCRYHIVGNCEWSPEKGFESRK